MRFLHLSDLHFGKSLDGVSFIDSGDQRFWVDRFICKAKELKPDAVVIAGDVYNRSSPSGDAIKLFGHMVTSLYELGIPVLYVAGNHDSNEGIAFLDAVLDKQNVHVAGTLEKKLKKVTLKDDEGEVDFFLMPYVFPELVKNVLDDEDITDYNSAITKLLAEQNIDFSRRTVLVAHQNVVKKNAEGKVEENVRGGSETMVGGVGPIDYRTFDGFDYVALGHIHAAYSVGRDTVRYAGSPLCYHFDETRQSKKGPLLVTMKKKPIISKEANDDNTEKDNEYITVERIDIEPLHELLQVEDTFEIICRNMEMGMYKNKYLKITITDQKNSANSNDVLRKLAQDTDCVILELLSSYRALSTFSYSRKEDRKEDKKEDKTSEDYFNELYRARNNGQDMPVGEETFIQQVADKVRELDDKTGNPDNSMVEALLAFLKGQED